MQLRRTFPLLLLLAGLAGCTPNDALFGGAVRHDYALQVIDPDPKPAGEAGLGADGKHAAAAADRYNKGTVTRPEPITTKSSNSGSK